MKEILLDDWQELERVLRDLGMPQVLVRNFDRVTFDDVETNPVEVDSVQVVRERGTDRRENANVWNYPNFDYDHEKNPAGKRPHELIYAYLADMTKTPYLVSMSDAEGVVTWRELDLGDLNEHHGVIVYDPAKFHRAAPNEYWFTTNPLDAALLLVLTGEPTGEDRT